MVKLTLRPNEHFTLILNQSPQKNPILWKMMLKGKDGSYTDTGPWIRCTDYFNDLVAYWKTGRVFSVYGFKNEVPKNIEGLWVLVDQILDKDVFLYNLAVVNEQLRKDLDCAVDVIDLPGQQMLFLFPNQVCEKTYYISALTKAIRMCNYSGLGLPPACLVRFAQWKDLWNKKNGIVLVYEHTITTPMCNQLMEHGFFPPEKTMKYWFFSGREYNSEKTPQMGGTTVHNCGVNSWLYMLDISPPA